MPNPAFVTAVANALGGVLLHPGDEKTGEFVIPLPTFHMSNIPNEVKQHFAEQAGLPHPDIARLTAEALDNTLDKAGLTVIESAELTRLRGLDAVTTADSKREITLECTCEGYVTAAMTQVSDKKFRVGLRALITAMQKMSPDCAVKHAPQAAL